MDTKIQIQAGDVFSVYTPFKFKRPMSWLSSLIRVITKDKYSHSAIAVEIWGRIFICEALAKGIVMKPIEEWPQGDMIAVSRPNFSFDKKAFNIKALSKVGNTGYDYSSLIFYQLIYQITGKWMGWTSATVRATNKFYCSEFVGWLYDSIFPDWYKTKPENIYDDKRSFIIIYEGKDDMIC